MSTERQASEPSRSGWLGAGVLLTSLALMCTEIVLTRVFSVVLWYHFAFFAVSIALLGLGAGAIGVRVFARELPADAVASRLSSALLVTAVGVLALGLGLLGVRPDWFGTGSSAFFTVMTPKLIGIFALTTLPFVAGGFALTLAFTRFGAAIHRLYAFDLLGAGAACALVVPLLDALGGPHALVACAGIAAAAAVCFAASSAAPRRARRIGASAAAALLVSLAGIFAARAGALDVRVAKGLDLRVAKPELERWNSFSLVSVFPFWPFRGWGLSPAYTGPVPAQKGLVIDMNAFTPLTPFAGDLSAVEHTRHDLSAFVFQLPERRDHVCVVGAGGGKDVLAALAAGSRRVTGVEVNPIIVRDVMRGRYRSYTGGLYERPDVEVHVEDGRTFLRSGRARYDVVLVSMVDTSAATAAGAFALAENALYTSDAFGDFLTSLRPNGILTVSSVSLPGLAVGARLASLARTALLARRWSVGDTVAVVETPWLGLPGATMFNFLIKPDGFSAAEVSALRAAADRMRFGIAYVPGQTAAGPGERALIHRILTAEDESALWAEAARWPLDVSPVSDDRPFFFYQNRLRDALSLLLAGSPPHLYGNGLVVLIKVLVAALCMLLLLVALPLWLARRRDRAAEGAQSPARLGADLGYVACIGLGFMFLEIGLIQRLLSYLGQPTYTLTAVLFVLLIGGGVGSRLSARLGTYGVKRALLGLIVYAGLLVLWLPSLTQGAAGLPPLGRAAIAGALLLPLGALLGVPLPSALSRAATRGQERVTWLWGVNSAASVLGSILATLVSMHLGITSSLALGVALYGAALALWPKVAA